MAPVVASTFGNIIRLLKLRNRTDLLLDPSSLKMSPFTTDSQFVDMVGSTLLQRLVPRLLTATESC